MALWGTLRHRLGGSVPTDSKEFVDNFFTTTPQDPRWGLSLIQKQTEEFVAAQLADQRRGIALITSGSTIVPMDPENDTFVDVVSHVQEQRGPACAEYFLQLGYAVIFVHRENSLRPFTRHFQKIIQNGVFMNMLRMQDDGLVLSGADISQQLQFQKITQLYTECSTRVLYLSFTSVQQYLMLTRITAKAVEVAKDQGIVVLSATLMDFYVPVDSSIAAKTIVSTVNEDVSSSLLFSPLKHSKTQSIRKSAKKTTKRKSGEFSVNFVRVPNIIHKIRTEWCPKAFLVTSKQQLASGEDIEAAHADLEKWGVDVIAGNHHSHEILLISEQEEAIVTCPDDEDINDAFASALADMHRSFRRKRAILARGKQLLLLSAKFSMLKEKDVVSEDADGNKNVQFGLGVKIRADRRAPDAIAPVYELKHIFQNKSRCARAHIWESVVEHSPRDVVVAFSPAGNPETIRDVWGDFWSGWAEDELQEFKTEMKGMSFSSAINLVTSSVSGNYEPASQLLKFMWSKIGHAWTDGEQTRVRQSIQNMMAVALDRGLTEPPGISILERLMRKPRIQRFDSLVLDQPTAVSVHAQRHTRRPRRDSDTDSNSSGEINPVRLSKARVVRVHRAINDYMQDMIEKGLLDSILKYVEQGSRVHVTGYSMGGMLGQLFMLYLGDYARMNAWDASKINFVGFGSPRVGDIGFAARLRVLFDPQQLLIIMHPSDAVHAFPPTAEGYVDACIKIFLREDGLGVARRTPGHFTLLPVTRSIDRAFEHAYKERAHENKNDRACSFCQGKTHLTAQHRCRYCIERGSHRGADCQNRNKPCLLCGNSNHCTGEHKCRVCQQYGHRGRVCHAQRDVGFAELLTYFRYHHFLYYNANLKKSVEFAS
ncbi:triacylglycerol lipase [Plasmopara halstedii]|uniref:Triacylglycerol lipase n=1 Tax=Plasmopara halstedii TaxID=4781 RepID=A0A0P1AE20_PLAHL|nr:triacylglycerol lipase [Plasmopara halstedii]CEG38782.1 triacylglycerol lipase [Plasmopara halstedii]|eukprot:XP_024575151.1 triacylglycerol lipase [Plasmopara halstedii]